MGALWVAVFYLAIIGGSAQSASDPETATRRPIVSHGCVHGAPPNRSTRRPRSCSPPTAMSANAIYAQISALRGQLPRLAVPAASARFAEYLEHPLVRSDDRLRLRCLVIKGETDEDLDPFLAVASWREAQSIAEKLGIAMNPGLARIIGVMLKLDFQRAVLQRIPKISAQPDRVWRDLMFVCDEYHAFATVGETDPTGDERPFALSRQARLIPIVATQSISSLRSVLPGDESWRTLLQCFRNKIFLATSDEFTARNAAELCGA